MFGRYSLIFGRVRVIFQSARKTTNYLWLSSEGFGEPRPPLKYLRLRLVVMSVSVLTSDIFVIVCTGVQICTRVT